MLPIKIITYHLVMTGSNKMHFATTAKVLYISKWAYKNNSKRNEGGNSLENIIFHLKKTNPIPELREKLQHENVLCFQN